MIPGEEAEVAKHYRIHPAIGIARVGNSASHFIGPEIPDVPAIPSNGKYKRQGRIKKQAARFRKVQPLQPFHRNR